MNRAIPIAGYGVGWASTLSNHSVGGVAIGTACNTNGNSPPVPR